MTHFIDVCKGIEWLVKVLEFELLFITVRQSDVWFEKRHITYPGIVTALPRGSCLIQRAVQKLSL